MCDIKANDIMIGNWFIGYDNKPFQWEIEHFSMLNTMFIDEIIKASIPLTEDILLKSGFEKSGISYVKSMFITDRWSDGRFWYGHRGGSIELKHLHQLQNLFKSLTGYELNYEYSK